MPTRGAAIDITTTSFFATRSLDRGPAAHVRRSACATSTSRPRRSCRPRPVQREHLHAAPRRDLRADRRRPHRGVGATYGHYAGTYNDVQFSRNSAAGNADRITGSYTGPSGEGLDFAPAFNPANYTHDLGHVPDGEHLLRRRPRRRRLTRETTLSLGRDFGAGLWARGRYVHRRATNFVEDYITIADGKTVVIRNGVNFGTFDNAVYRNSDRRQARVRRDRPAVRLAAAAALTVAGQWTVAAPQPRQLRRGGGEQPGDSVDHRRLPGDLRRVAQLPDGPRRRLPAQQGPRCGRRTGSKLGRRRPARPGADRTATTRAGRSATPRRCAMTPQQIANNPGYARTPDVADAVLRRARRRHVRRLRPGGPRDDLDAFRCGGRCRRG